MAVTTIEQREIELLAPHMKRRMATLVLLGVRFIYDTDLQCWRVFDREWDEHFTPAALLSQQIYRVWRQALLDGVIDPIATSFQEDAYNAFLHDD